MVKSNECPGCGAPAEIPAGVASFFCSFCGTALQVPDEMITAVEIVEPTPTPEADADWKNKIYAEIDEWRQIGDRAEMMTVPLGLGLIAPGFFGGFFGCSLLTTNGYVGYAFLCGAICGPLFIVGVTLLIYFSKKKERADARIKQLETQLGKDTRSLGEKVLDRGFGWMFGKK